jgi:hypothetical protein
MVCNTELMGFLLCPLSGILKNIQSRKLYLFPFSGEGVGDTILGPLEIANLNHWIQHSRCLPPPRLRTETDTVSYVL